MKYLLTLFVLILASCQSPNDNSVTTSDTFFILCEGNFGSSNATLWTLDEDFTQTTGPVHWDPNANPLGDVAQSLTVAGDNLYIVVNNSHTIEVMDLSADGPTYNRTIDIPGASPRYLEVYAEKAYVSCWGLKGILVIDLTTDDFLDTIAVNGMPEDLEIQDQSLYAGLVMDPFWGSEDKILKIDLTSQPVIVDSFTVVPGPERLLLQGNTLYVASTYYDANWAAHRGMSAIDLTNGNVVIVDRGTSDGSLSDMVLFQDEVYQLYDGGAVPLTASLQPDTTRKIGDFPQAYSLGVLNQYLIFGTTDYVAPDEVIIVNKANEIIAELPVGALPGDFAAYANRN